MKESSVWHSLFRIAPWDILVLLGVQYRLLAKICIFVTPLTIVFPHYFGRNHSFNFFPTNRKERTMEYNFGDIEKKWRRSWTEQGAYKVSNDPSRPKFYVLDMFPYPSGAGLHV